MQPERSLSSPPSQERQGVTSSARRQNFHDWMRVDWTFVGAAALSTSTKRRKRQITPPVQLSSNQPGLSVLAARQTLLYRIPTRNFAALPGWRLRAAVHRLLMEEFAGANEGRAGFSYSRLESDGSNQLKRAARTALDPNATDTSVDRNCPPRA